MNSGMVNSYKGYIGNKRIYLKRKKQLNRSVRQLKKYYKRFNKASDRWLLEVMIDSRKDDIYMLRLMWNFHKFKHRRLDKNDKAKPVR